MNAMTWAQSEIFFLRKGLMDTSETSVIIRIKNYNCEKVNLLLIKKISNKKRLDHY